VPLLGHSGHAVAAIGVACPASRFTADFIDRVAEPALAHGREISRALGHREPATPWLAIS
jgi:DNA-binding IclR family transcriptional regulator